ncbi:MAG: OmpH family outer membrane protein, partial [Bacteroidales bacterium]|nr:OmpH family outer membrane protein [Bacteroidales bacterium]
LQTIADSLNAAAKRVNADHNASYIFTYQSGGQLLYADPAHDITVEVLDELNKSFKKKKK